ncbi:PH domain-containing protein [Nonomuraea sp. NEAU-A123]|uniref:PH domain-containing protein n=1 Tax=Nonomuraea sp. NEAU-A123 TaxID=2839649 RepID=UPI001BE3F6D8|nr:PH domain-containing protein [Nonomuraea sp. NEAU-A123]MBT2224491.1 PH domain-containing protein [Nonomuraea sp. NEAU-A123]
MKQTYRSKTAFVLGWVWLAFVAFNIWDLTARYNGKPSLVAGAVLGALTAVVYLVALRPATVVTEEGLVGRNPLRSTFVPWASVNDVVVAHTINVRYGAEQVLRLWTPMSTARERARAQRRSAPRPQRGRFKTEPTLSKAEQAAAEAFAGKTHADWVGQQITERAESARRRDVEAPPARASWAIDSFAVLAAAIALVVMAVVIG